jgi:hypothetical protein
MTGYGLDYRCSIPDRDRDFSLHHHTRLAFEPTQWVPGTIRRGKPGGA